MTIVMRTATGGASRLRIDRWCAPASPGEIELLAELDGPVLDLGCGPGRLVVALGQLGIPALGVDAAPAAIGRATTAGAPALERSVFDHLPGEGRWPSVLLLDGNVGIGGDPGALLERVATLLAARGVCVVEVDPPGVATARSMARLEHEGTPGRWFPWAWVGADDIDAIAAPVGLACWGWRRLDDRWLALLGRSEHRPSSRLLGDTQPDAQPDADADPNTHTDAAP